MTAVMTERRPGSPWPLAEDGVWIEPRAARATAPRAGLFLDRDGVIIEDAGYIADPETARLTRGAAALIADANASGVAVAVVTNQSGIDRGLYGWDGFAAVTARIDALLATEGARIDALAACPFHPDFTAGYGAAQARWRKPGPGMITALAVALGVDPARSWLVGDAPRDIAAARAAGLAGAVLVGSAEAADDTGGGGFVALAAGDMAAARAVLGERLFAHARSREGATDA